VFEKPLVLVVEDDPDSFEATGRLLGHVGYAVAGARTLADAFAQFRTLRPRYVVLDLSLPDGNGVEFLRHVRERQAPVMVLVTTGTEDDALLKQVRALSPDGVFKKPLEIPALLAWMRQHRGTMPGRDRSS
jgi:DNA-binding response OmpR family regulator